LHVYTQLGIDIATDHIDRTPIRDEIQESFWIAVLGLAYPTPPVVLFVDLEWQSNVVIGEGERQNFLVMPGVRYELPPIAWIPALVNIDLGVRVGLVDSLGRFDVGVRLTFDAKNPQD
jgi:hypothetical protein